MQRIKGLVLSFLWVFLALTPGRAESGPTSLDESFQRIALKDELGGANFASIYELILQPDGKILARGDFASVNEQPRPGLARLLADGALDSSFAPAPGPERIPTTFALQKDGRVLLGYWMANDGVIIRLNSDGTVDAKFHPFSIWGPRKILQGNDNKIYVAATSSFINGRSQRYLARLHPAGEFDVDYFPPIEAFPGVMESGLVTIALQPDDKVVMGGFFNTAPTQNHVLGLARFQPDGSLDSSFTNAAFIGEYCRALAIQPDGKILRGDGMWRRNASGDDTDIYATVWRYLPDRSADPNFHFSEMIPGVVSAIALQADGKIIATGGFTDTIDIWREHIIRLNADGTTDSSFGFGSALPARHGENINSVVVQPDGKILLAGKFNYGVGAGNARSDLIRIRGNPTGLAESKLSDDSTVTFKWRLLDTNLTYAIQTSTNLQTWVNAGVTTGGQAEIHHTVAITQGPQVFVRLIAE